MQKRLPERLLGGAPPSSAVSNVTFCIVMAAELSKIGTFAEITFACLRAEVTSDKVCLHTETFGSMRVLCR